MKEALVKRDTANNAVASEAPEDGGTTGPRTTAATPPHLRPAVQKNPNIRSNEDYPHDDICGGHHRRSHNHNLSGILKNFNI
jgi:hypothetical protein